MLPQAHRPDRPAQPLRAVAHVRGTSTEFIPPPFL